MNSTGKIKYPEPLKAGDKIGITAPSSGTNVELHPRLDLVLNHLRAQGFVVVEGECLRERHKHVSGPKEKRATELMRFWRDQEIKAIMPPWGGEILVEILPLLDFEELKRLGPKWVSGYSDLSTLHFALTLRTGFATLHGANLMDLAPTQTDPLTKSLMPAMSLKAGESFFQDSSLKFQKQWLDFKTHVDAPLSLTEPTEWKALNPLMLRGGKFSGRMIGGCLDTIARLVGTSYGNLPEFIRAHSRDGTIFYFENCELTPCELARTLWNIRLAGWFDGLNGVLIGRSAGPDATSPADLSYEEVLRSVLGDLRIPIVYDVDIGHRPPNMSIINGSLATVELSNGRGKVKQALV